MEPTPEHTPRIGTFFLLVGFGLLVLFLGSGFSRNPNFAYLLFSLPALFLGYLLRRRAPRQPSGRFGIIHRARERSRQRREEKKNQPK
jgi:hypothetical protein